VVRGDLNIPLNLMAAMRLGADEYLGRENRYDVLGYLPVLVEGTLKDKHPRQRSTSTTGKDVAFRTAGSTSLNFDPATPRRFLPPFFGMALAVQKTF
jgi:hypothetical protein